MKITAFIGKSGTGKSYKSMGIARELGIDYIIDDGLVIRGNRLLGGKSAKSESSRIQAVKRALFMQKKHRDEVKKILKRENPESILLIGTSDNMVEKIAAALEIGEIDEKIYIADISTQEEMEMAVKQREDEGTHIIPLPTFEIKKDFSGYFMNTMNVIKMRNYKQEVYEKTVVRPSFSYLGKYSISDKVIRDIARHAASTVEGVDKAYRIHTETQREGIVINIDIFAVRGYNIWDISKSVQAKVKGEVESMTSINTLKVNITVSRYKNNK